MTNERRRSFEQDLSVVLRQVAGDGAPASLRYRLADVTASPSPAGRWWFAPPLRWAAAAVAVVAIAAIAFLMVPRENVGPAPSTSAQATASGAPASGEATPSSQGSSTAAPSVSEEPTPSPSAAPAAWATLTWTAPAAAPGLVEDVIAWGSGYVGVGAAWREGGLDAAFFTSPDGMHWSLSTRQATTDSNVIVEHVVHVGARLVAVGNAVMDAPGEKPGFAPFLWVSDDGLHWTQVHDATWDAALLGRGVSRLVAGSAGLMAASLGSDPIVLHSSDGNGWTRAVLPATVRVVANDGIAIAGGFLIVGRDGEPDHFSEAVINSQSPPGVGKPAAWISADGIHWSEASVEGSTVAGAGLTNVIAVRSGLLAVGINSTADFYASRMTSWISSDGRTWSIATDAEWPLGPYIPALASDGEHALLFGWAPEGAALAAWVTTDGLHWTRLAFGNAGNAPMVDCGSGTCVRFGSAWIEPDRVIVMAAESSSIAGGTAQWFWAAIPGS